MRYFISIFLLLNVFTVAIGAQGTAVTYQVKGQSYEGYYISPSDQAPFVLLIHDWDGLTDYEVKRANMLAELGYSVFALDLFGAGVRPTKVTDKRQHTGELYKNREKMRALMKGALDTAKDKGARIDNAAVVGYCFGGAAVLELARSGADLKGFATFHGGLKTPPGQNYTNTRGKILIMHGSADTAITLDPRTDHLRWGPTCFYRFWWEPLPGNCRQKILEALYGISCGYAKKLKLIVRFGNNITMAYGHFLFFR